MTLHSVWAPDGRVGADAPHRFGVADGRLAQEHHRPMRSRSLDERSRLLDELSIENGESAHRGDQHTVASSTLDGLATHNR
jgi:hypothetical protein